MMNQYFENLINGIESRLKHDPRSLSPGKIYALEIARLGKSLYSRNSRIAWCGVAVPFELLNAMGITSCFVEFIGAMLAGISAAEPCLKASEQYGYATDFCGYHRAVIGAAYMNIMPVPDFLIGTNCPCSGGLATIENLSRMFKKDMFVINIPLNYSDANIKYLGSELRKMVQFVESRSGSVLIPEKLMNALELANQAREILEQVYELASQIPSPLTNKDLRNFGIVFPLFLGTKSAVEIARIYRDTFIQRISEKKFAPQRFRILWIQNRIQFDNPVIQILEEEYKALIVIDELNCITWEPLDPETPFESFARRITTFPINGSFSRRAENLKKLVRMYKIHAAINPCHWGCRQGTGARGLVEKTLNELEIPVLNLEIDCIDSRNFSPGQLKTRLQAFMEMLENRYGSCEY